MNSFGRKLRVSIFGESHGESVGVVIDGCPAGLPLLRMIFPQTLEEERQGQKALLRERKMMLLK